MKNAVFLSACIALAGAAFAEEEPVPVENVLEPVALTSLGDVDEALMQRAAAWARDNLAIPVPVKINEAENTAGSFEEVRDLLAGMGEDGQLGLVVLWDAPEGVSSHGTYFPDEKVAVVNVRAMKEGGPDEETFARRVERQVIRGICFAMGLEPNPNPQSAMFSYSTMEELDAIGRNLDPPWLMRLQKAAQDAGVPVDPENPFNLVTPR